MSYIDCSLERQIIIDLIEYNDYLNWHHKRDKCFIVETMYEDRLDREKLLHQHRYKQGVDGRMGEPMRTLFLQCCPRNASAIPSYEELLMQECWDVRNGDEEYQCACGGCDEGKSEEIAKLYQSEAAKRICQENSSQGHGGQSG